MNEGFLKVFDEYVESFREYVKNRKLTTSNFTVETLFLDTPRDIPLDWTFGVYGRKLIVEFCHPIEEYPKKEEES
jgi:hypothetical protein